MYRVITYIDGFNLYFGLKASRYRCYYWLDLWALSANLLRPGQELVLAKYFTARISSPPDKQRRQSTYLEALDTIPSLDIFYGKYQHQDRTCRHCGYIDQVPSEKMTDVNIAVELMTDAFLDRFDTALLISADSDLSAPVAAVRDLFPEKRVVVAFPPKRSSVVLSQEAHAFFHIGRNVLADSLLPREIQKPDGFVLSCPPSWR